MLRIVAIAWGCLGLNSFAVGEARKPAPIPAQTIAAYEKLGGIYATFRSSGENGIEIHRVAAPTEPDDLPGFLFHKRPSGKLPDPGVPFALDFAFEARDADFLTLLDLVSVGYFHFESEPITEAGLSVFDRFKNLRWFDLDHPRIYAGWLEQFPKLTTLIWKMRGKSDVASIAKLPALQRLGIGGEDLGDEELAALGELKSLTQLGIGESKVTGVGLKGFANLQRLHIDPAPLHAGGWKAIAALPNLTELAIRNCPMFAIETNGFAKLKRADIDCPELDDAGMKTIASMSGLAELRLRSKTVTDAGLGELKQLTELKKLDLEEIALTDEGMPLFRMLGKLETLELSKTKITGAGLRELKACRDLKSLSLDGIAPDRQALAFVAGCRTLRSFSANWNGPEVAQLAQLPDIEELRVGQTLGLLRALKAVGKLHAVLGWSAGSDRLPLKRDRDILSARVVSDAEIDIVKDLPNLEELSVREKAITNAGMRDVAGMQNLRKLNLSDTSVTNAGLAELAGVKKLTELRLSQTQFGDDCIPILKTLVGLKTLYVGGTKITDAKLGELLALPNLEYLGVDNKIQVTDRLLKTFRGKGKRQILSCFGTDDQTPPRSEAEITRVVLSGPAITDRTLDELRDLENVRGINLWGTAITDAGLAKLVCFPKLEDLELWGTPITGAGLAHFPNPQNFKFLGLGDTKLDAKGLLLVHRFGNLTSLHLNHLRFEPETFQQLQKDFPNCDMRR